MDLPPKKRGWRPTPRSVIRCCILLACAAAVLPALPWVWPAAIVPATSPYVGICSAIATRTVGWLSLAGVPLLVVSLRRRRWFCLHACPTGFLLECAAHFSRMRALKLPAVGPWLVLLTLAGACVGYPWLLWADPMAMFSAGVGLLGGLASAAGFCLVAVLVLNVLWPNIWCVRICPLGATQDILALPRQLARANRPAASADARSVLSRRIVLAGGAAALWSAVVRRGSPNTKAGLIRPPGSVEEARFSALCVRCASCIRVCPAKIIRPDLGAQGIAGFLAPTVQFEVSYCLEDCRKCTEVCPSGAIERLSLEEKKGAAMGRAKVSLDRCLLSDDRECFACESQCPYEAVQIAFDETTYVTSPRVDSDRCTGCGACQVACPTDPKAIIVESC